MLDRAMVVVTADHGFSWEVGVKDRRKLTQSNIDEIGPQPLFIKAPGQRRGRVDRSYVRTVDIVPTMADILGIPVNWRHDGRSAFSRTTRRRRVIRIPTRDFSRIISIGARELERRRQANLRRRIREYGTGGQSKLWFGDPFLGVYLAVPHRELPGRPLAALKLVRAGRTRAAVAGAALTRSVDLRSGPYPHTSPAA